MRVLGAIAVGHGPRGIAVDPQRGIAWVDNALDASVSRVDLRKPLDPEHLQPADLTLVRPLPARFSPQALAGRRVFHDATDRHLTPRGIIACSTCHPDGGEDGLVWFLHAGTVTRRHRRSMDLAGARPGQVPMHWDGEFTDLHALLGSTVTNLMGGDGLLLDSAEIAAYLQEIVRPPVPPPQESQAVARGRALFESPTLGCATCHAGPDLSDGAQHAVLSPMSLDPLDKLTSARTPSLRGVFLRAPYFHDGRSPDLTDLHRRHDLQGHGHAEDLDDAQLLDLVTYLKTL
jgi:cytochrome c peroxidase